MAALLAATITAMLVATPALAQPAGSGDSGKVLVCHQGEQGPETISVSENAVPGHQAHGDTLGACGDGGGGGEACTLVGEPLSIYTEAGDSRLVERGDFFAISAEKPLTVDESSPPTITVQDAAGNTHTFVTSMNSLFSGTEVEGPNVLLIEVITAPDTELQTEGLVVTDVVGLGCEPATP